MIDYKNLSIVGISAIPIGGVVPIDNPMEIYRLAVHMEPICVKNHGVALSATQVGVPYNFFVVINENGNEYYANCSYEGTGEKSTYVEACLSLRNEDGSFMHFEVPRYRSVRVRGHKLMVNKDEVSVGFMEIDELYDGMRAIVCQHEIDHANGILISQVGRQIHIHRS
jgi:peptide deformylase